MSSYRGIPVVGPDDPKPDQYPYVEVRLDRQINDQSVCVAVIFWFADRPGESRYYKTLETLDPDPIDTLARRVASTARLMIDREYHNPVMEQIRRAVAEVETIF